MSGPKKAAAAEPERLDGGAEKRITEQVVNRKSTASVCPLACGRDGCTWLCPVPLHDALAELLDSLGVSA